MSRQRWRRLLVGTLVALAGLMWLRARFGSGDDVWELTRIGGLILGAAIAYAGMQRELRVKWPAAVALVCIAPIARDGVDMLEHIRYLLTVPGTGLPILVVIAAAGYSVVAAVQILVSKPVPVEEPIAPAHVVDD